MTSTPLDWHEGRDEFRVMPTFVAYTQRGRYKISHNALEKRAPWYARRMNHALMPPFDGYCETIEEAKEACACDFVALARADRWLDYMRDNGPPE